ncbi:hypothetical protein K438DRAFT_1987652 [Mycena galopus ATCC 62051]|nr:hypothetical protein K438DRAFT_1987652 [Mycena galopus ATCC 62051]
MRPLEMPVSLMRFMETSPRHLRRALSCSRRGSSRALQELEVSELVEAYCSTLSFERAAAPFQPFDTRTLCHHLRDRRAGCLAPAFPLHVQVPLSTAASSLYIIFACNIASTTTDPYFPPHTLGDIAPPPRLSLPLDHTRRMLDGVALLFPASVSALSTYPSLCWSTTEIETHFVVAPPPPVQVPLELAGLLHDRAVPLLLTSLSLSSTYPVDKAKGDLDALSVVAPPPPPAPPSELTG